jgi:hypothetical protein
MKNEVTARGWLILAARQPPAARSAREASLANVPTPAGPSPRQLGRENLVQQQANDLTAISGYAEIMLTRTEPVQTYTDLKKIVDRAKKSMGLVA